METDKD